MVRHVGFGDSGAAGSGSLRIGPPAPGAGPAPARHSAPPARPRGSVRRRGRGGVLVILAIVLLGLGLLAALLTDARRPEDTGGGLLGDIAAWLQRATGEPEHAASPGPSRDAAPEPARPAAEPDAAAPTTRPAPTGRNQNSGSRGG